MVTYYSCKLNQTKTKILITIHPPSPDNRPKSKSSIHGERYAEECIKENEEKTGNKCNFKRVSSCVADKCYENDDDYTNDCTLAGTILAQKYCN